MITGIILASGFSKRMGENKLLLEIHGEKIIEKVIKSANESNLDKIILIYRTEDIGVIGKKYNIETIHNEKADLGQSEGMKLGIKVAENTEAYMFILGDQPFLNSKFINKLIKEYKEGELPILVPYFNRKRGMPIIISSIFKKELLEVVGDKGGRDIVENNLSQVNKIHVQEEKLGIDIDTPEDFKKYK